MRTPDTMPHAMPRAEFRPEAGPLSLVQLLSAVSLARRQKLHWVIDDTSMD